MQRGVLALLPASSGLFAGTLPPLVCASGGAVATIDLRVASASPRNPNPLPMRTINRIEEGDTIRYRPLLRPKEERRGDVTLVLVPADKKSAGKSLLIFDPRPAGKPQQWTAPWRVAFAAFVYGPAGLNVKKVQAFLNRDDEIVGELADYADKTAKTEALIAALTSSDNSPQTVNAALAGFSSKFGVGQIARTAPTDQQAMVLFQNLNPTVASYDPLASQTPQSVGQTAGLATSVGEMFFGSPVGLAAGGTALLLNLGAIAFPRSEFRSAFSQPMPNDGVGLCGKVGAGAVHTRVDYLWAVWVPNSNSPRLEVGKSNSLPLAVKSPLPLTGAEEDWKYLDRARNWAIQPDNGKPIPVKVNVLANTKSIELDMGKAAKSVKPGRYNLTANWDWDAFEVRGFFNVRPLTDFASVKPTPTTQDQLVTGTGKVLLTLQNADFEFVTKVEIKKPGDEFATASAVPFVLPKGLREGVQDLMDIQVSTGDLDPGNYNLMVSQVDGKSHNISLKVLPPLPAIENLPVSVNQGVSSINFGLKGKRLGLIDRVEFSQGTVTLGAASSDGTEREVTIKLASGIAPGTKLSAKAFVADRVAPVKIEDAVTMLGPRPMITGLTISQLPAQSIALGQGELPGGLTLSALIRVENFRAGSGVKLACEQPGLPATATLHPGQESGTPRIEQFNLTRDDQTGDYRATLVGLNLETIGQTGWTANDETPVAQLPQPLSGDGRRQKLEIRMAAPPAPEAVLYVSLRGDSKGRQTIVHAN